MAIAFRAIGTASNVASGNLSPGMPAGAAANDILVLVVAQADNVALTVTGWTNKMSVTNGATCKSSLYWIRHTGSTTAPTVTHTAGAGSSASILAFSGVDSGLADPFRDLQSTTGTVAAGSVTFTVTGPALTGVVSGDMRGFYGMESGADTSSIATGNWTAVTGFTERLDGGEVAGSTHATLAVDTLLATGAAASITSTANGTGFALAKAWVGSQWALSSDASGAVVMPPPPLISSFAVTRASSF